MVTLAAGVSSTATTWSLSAALPAGTDYLQVDEELVAVVTPAIRPSQRDDPTLFCEVVRGMAGTQATHAQGATLTTLPAPPLGGGDGTQTVRLLGPFTVNFNDTFPVTTTLVVPAGALVLSGLCFVTTAWDTDEVLSVMYPDLLAVDEFAVGDDWWVSADRCAPRVLGTEGFGGTAGSIVANGSPIRFSSESALRVSISDAGPTQGQADIYALIAEPA